MNILKAVSLKLASTLAFTIMGVQVRYLEGAVPIGQVAFFRSLFALFLIVLVFGWRGELRTAFRTKHPSAHLVRGLFSVVGTFCTFGALARIPIADFTAIAFIAPLITVIFAALLLKERVHVYRWSAVAVGLVGVILMLTPYFGDSVVLASAGTAGVAFALGNALCTAGATIQVKRITATETTSSIMMFATMMVLVASLLTIPFGWVMPSTWLHWGLLISIGVVGGIGQMLFTDSYRYAPASFLAPFDYTSMLWAFVLGYWVFGEAPTLYVVIGSVIVAGAGIFVILRERQLGLRRRRDTPVSAIAVVVADDSDPDAALDKAPDEEGCAFKMP